MSILDGTRTVLRAWGYWGRPPNIGMPVISPMFVERALKTPLYGADGGSPDILAVDAIVSKIPRPERVLLIERYQWVTPGKLLAQKYGWSTRTYFRRLEAAEWSVHVGLHG